MSLPPPARFKGPPSALRVTGHTGEQSAMMGRYEVNVEHSPREGANVYTLVGSSSSLHMYRATDGKWDICDTESMVAAEAAGWIASSTASLSPLSLQWEVGSNSGFHPDPLLTVTEMSTTELAAARAAFETEKQRALAIVALHVRGHTGKWRFLMGTYALNAEQSRMEGGSVYTLVGSSSVHCRAASGKWLISDTGWSSSAKATGWIASSTVSPSPLGLKWKQYGAVRNAFVIDPLLTVTEAGATELAAARAAFEAEQQRGLAIIALRVSGHTGEQSDKMGQYTLDAALSPVNDSNVYTLQGSSDDDHHISRGPNGFWFICSTAFLITDRRSWQDDCVLASTTPSASPLGLKWKRGTDDGIALEPLLTVRDEADVAAEEAAALAQAARKTEKNRVKRQRKRERERAKKAAQRLAAQPQIQAVADDAVHCARRASSYAESVAAGVEQIIAQLLAAQVRSEAADVAVVVALKSVRGARAACSDAEESVRHAERVVLEHVHRTGVDAVQHARACTDAAFEAVRGARDAAALAAAEVREREAAAAAAVEDIINTDEYFALLTGMSAVSLADAAPLPPPPPPAREVPDDFECPITTELMVDPVFAADGETYERAAIEEWFALGKTTSPMSGDEIDPSVIFSNKRLWRQIAAWKKESGR